MPTRRPALRLIPINPAESGERLDPLVLEPSRTIVVGRSSEADWRLGVPSVSRRHASFTCKADTWFLTDMSSRHGTFLNGQRIAPRAPMPIQHGDTIAFGTWPCVCSEGRETGRLTTEYTLDPAQHSSISTFDQAQLSGIAQRGLDALLELAEHLDSAVDDLEASSAAVSAVERATGCRRVLVVRPSIGGEIEILAATSEHPPLLSRSLIERASSDGIVQVMHDECDVAQSHSIMQLNIRSAICASIVAGTTPSAFLMLDTRDSEAVLPADAVAFTKAVARLTGLAFERIGARTLAERHLQLQFDLDAARRAQELLLPPVEGHIGRVSYRYESLPGRIVAGDLFDVFPIDDVRTGFFLGDVTGKGVGAAMLMAACQSQLRSRLLSGLDLAAAVAAVNADLHHRTEDSKFVTLVAGVIDSDRETVKLIDAGHGLCVMCPKQGPATRVEASAGIPLGIMESAPYDVLDLPLEAGGHLLLFSDGAVEQADEAGGQFGLQAVIDVVGATTSPDTAVAAIVEAVRRHADGDLADDLTVAALWLR